MTEMTEQVVPAKQEKSIDLKTAVLLILPLVLLAAAIALFLDTGGGLTFREPAPVESLTVERTVLERGRIEVVVRNGSPEAVEISQVVINEAVWPFEMTPAPTIPRLGEATLHLEYPWVEGEAYVIRLFTTNAIPFEVEIPAAFTTPQPTQRTFVGFALIGLYVGVIPIALGLAWFPALRQLGRRWMVVLMALTAGLLVYLGIDTLSEALEMAAEIAGPLQGVGLVGIGAVATFLLLDAIGQRQTSTGRDESARRLEIAYLIALGIGLHNLGEGLAIGAAYSVGELALGSFLVVGFMIQNITEGLGIIAPVLRDRPGLKHLAIMGLIGGAPAILGAWIGGFTPSPVLAVLFFAIGTGAIAEVIYEIAKLIRHDTAREPMAVSVFSGVVAGMLLLWVTGLLIK
jgi:zinc transporter ZupT